MSEEHENMNKEELPQKVIRRREGGRKRIEEAREPELAIRLPYDMHKYVHTPIILTIVLIATYAIHSP